MGTRTSDPWEPLLSPPLSPQATGVGARVPGFFLCVEEPPRTSSGLPIPPLACPSPAPGQVQHVSWLPWLPHV